MLFRSQGQSREQVADWASKTTPAAPQPTMKRSASLASRPPISRSGTQKKMVPVRKTYASSEEGYGSGDYEDSIEVEVIRIRIKLHWRDEVA